MYENWGYIPYQEYSKIQLTGKQAPGSYWSTACQPWWWPAECRVHWDSQQDHKCPPWDGETEICERPHLQDSCKTSPKHCNILCYLFKHCLATMMMASFYAEFTETANRITNVPLETEKLRLASVVISRTAVDPPQTLQHPVLFIEALLASHDYGTQKLCIHM